jgi:hypothetical protein
MNRLSTEKRVQVVAALMVSYMIGRRDLGCLCDLILERIAVKSSIEKKMLLRTLGE